MADAREALPPGLRPRFDQLAEDAAFFRGYLVASGRCDETESEPIPSSAERTTDAERAGAACDVADTPSLAEPGAILFNDLWAQAQQLPMDDAVSRLEGVLDLVQHHPALASKVALMRSLCAAWWALLPGEDTCRFSAFELSLDKARSLKMPEVVPHMMKFAKAYLERPELARELDQLATISETWSLLDKSAIVERGQKL